MPLEKRSFEHTLEKGLFASRWLMVPIYLGLVFMLGLLVVVFFRELAHDLPKALGSKPEFAIILALSLIDLSLTGNLLLIVILAGYENFVSQIETNSGDRPSWMGRVDYSGMKMKLIASVAAISAVSVLKLCLKMSEDPDVEFDQIRLGWLVGIHVAFIVSGVLMATMDWISGKVTRH
ncbi:MULTISPECIES: YqhA family protein [unclassified Caulobacter]|uniref:YqhA family protein n=1 Tax=unclassified Caulobacter TaxID=2648921 RepID=UPI0004A6AD55|nr:YqhA family protein [Caulobacter sp. UNC358MFTsu5.1]